MTESQDGQAAGLRRAKRWLANARVTANVAAAVANPLAGPVADRFDSGPPRSTAEVTQQLQKDAQQDWARHELVRREQTAGEGPVPSADAKNQRIRKR
ncbi:hypothetical protein NOCA2480080 [metagenome]|uniref:Uncharacterized protein n=1 Tax=metagenome TaxID=256318 RepID=A0A2P2C7V2_9ZZZZ